MILLIDNYDSFTHNLAQLVRVRSGCEQSSLHIVRNDAVPPEDLAQMPWEHVILSPGPGHPSVAGLSLSLPPLIPETPLLGVCLGHQALACSAGGQVKRAPRPCHGSPVSVHHDGSALFAGLESPFPAALYHSLSVETSSLPQELLTCAWTSYGDIMGLRHRNHPHFGVQFHPESFMTENGGLLLDNFLAMKSHVLL